MLQTLPNTAKEDTFDDDEDTETEGETIEDSVEDSDSYKLQCNAIYYVKTMSLIKTQRMEGAMTEMTIFTRY